MASAFVAGVAALVWSHFQMMSAEQVRRRLQETAVDLGATGRNPYFGYGRIDLFSALSQPLFQICVLQLGVKQPNQSVSWSPVYAYPGLPPSQCQNRTEYYADLFERTIVIHQFNQTRTYVDTQTGPA